MALMQCNAEGIARKQHLCKISQMHAEKWIWQQAVRSYGSWKGWEAGRDVAFEIYIYIIYCQLGDYIVTYHLLREPETAIDFRGYYPYFRGSFVSSHHFGSTSPGCCSSTFDSWQLADSHALVSCGGGAACPGWDFSETLY